MNNFEYKVVTAPHQGKKARGVKTTADRFALALSDVLNEMAAEGWEYVRAETLPCDERRGLTGTQTTFQNMLIFRRALEVAGDEAATDMTPVVAVKSPPPLALRNVHDLDVHDDADPVSADLGDTLRATRETDRPTARRLGPATADD
jgi:hypothetical protein